MIDASIAEYHSPTLLNMLPDLDSNEATALNSLAAQVPYRIQLLDVDTKEYPSPLIGIIIRNHHIVKFFQKKSRQGQIILMINVVYNERKITILFDCFYHNKL